MKDYFGNEIKTGLARKSKVNTLDDKIAKCAVDLLEATNAFHYLHLSITGQGSDAAHRALNELYDALPDLVDTIVEGYQGATEKLLVMPETESIRFKNVEEALAFLRKKSEMISEMQKEIPYSEIVNNMDLIKDAINKAKYKLIFLK